MRGTHGERRDQAFLHWKCNGNGDGCFDALHVGHRLLIRTIQCTCKDLLIKLQKSNGITTGKDFTGNCTKTFCEIIDFIAIVVQLMLSACV